MSSPQSLLSFVFLLILSFFPRAQAGFEPQLRAGKILFCSLYTFGDSLVDPGNNDFIQTIARSNFPPYGVDFVDQKPTGRFSNGRLIPDFLAFDLGAPDYQQAYLSASNLNVTAVSFASATSGYDPQTSSLTGAIEIQKQLAFFQEYKARLQSAIGAEKADEQIKTAIFYISTGSSDITFSFYGDGNATGKRGMQFHCNVTKYEEFLMPLVKQFIQGLWNEGARKFAVTGLPPLGCLPVAITVYQKISERSCYEVFNNVTRDYNVLLQNELTFIQSTLSESGTKIAYIDIERPLLDIIRNPAEHEFTEASRGCCGTGFYEIGPTCNESVPICASTSDYVFWDAAHPSEKTYEILYDSNLPKIFQLIEG